MSGSLWPYGLQKIRLHCLSLSPRVCSNSCPLSQWCHSTISSSVVPSPPAFNLSQHQGLSQWIGFSHQVAKVLELQHQSFQWIFRVDLFQDWLVWSPCNQETLKSLLQHHNLKASILRHSTFFMANSHIHTWLLEKP